MTITYPSDPSIYQTTPWTDQNGKQWIADAKGRFSEYVEPSSGASAWADITGKPAAVTGTTASFTTALESKLDGIEEGATEAGESGDAYATSHESDTTAHPAANIVNTPAGSISATTVQSALNELDSKKIGVWEEKTSSFTAAANGRYICTATLTITLPSDTPLGTVIEFIVISGTTTLSGPHTASPLPVRFRHVGSNFWYEDATGTGAAIPELSAANLTGSIAVARIASALNAGGNPIACTTLTASGAVTASNLEFTAGGRWDSGAYWAISPSLVGDYGGRLQLRGNTLTNSGMSMDMHGKLRWGIENQNPYDSDVRIERASAGVLEINNDNAGQYRDLKLRNLTASGTVKTGSYTKAAAIASSHATAIAAGDGAQTYISDDDKPAWSNGTVWKLADGTTLA